MGAVLAGLFSRLTPGIEAPVRPEHASIGARPARAAPARVGWCSSCRRCLRWTPSRADSWSRASWPTGFTRASASQPGVLGAIFFGANVLAGISALLAARIAAQDRADQHDGLHPHPVQHPADAGAAHADACRWRSPLLLLRFSISQMDVPDPPVVHDGGGQPRRALGGGRRDGDCAHDRARRSHRRLLGRCWRVRRCWVCRSSCPAGSRSSTTCCCTAVFAPLSHQKRHSEAFPGSVWTLVTKPTWMRMRQFGSSGAI